MTLLTTRILWNRLGIRGVSPTASTSTLPSSFIDIQHQYRFGAAIHSECALHNTSLYDPIQSANNDRLMKHHNRPKVEYQWKQQRRLFAHQTDNMTDMTPQEMASLQSKLFHEASYLTRTLYRKCIQSAKILGEGNERDEEDFATREDEERNDGSVNLERISMAPPVDRQNELSSRSNYYKTFTREHFDGHWSLLGAHGFHIGDEGSMTHGLGGGGQQSNQYQGGHHHLGGQMSAQYQGRGGNSALQHDSTKSNAEHYMWREDKVEQFVYLIKSGEERRQWVLDDYDFEDSDDGWPKELERRLKNFEALTGSLVREMYRRKGWTHSSDINNHDDKDDFFSDSDSDDDL